MNWLDFMKHLLDFLILFPKLDNLASKLCLS